MKSIKAIAQTTWILIIIVIVLIAALGGVVLYYSGVLTPGEQLPTPEFVTNNTLVYESGATFEWLDPHVSYYQYDYWVLYHTVEQLLWNNGESAIDIVPWLADSYEVVAGSSNTRYKFTLRQGIEFQDGTPFNSTAVWFSLNRLIIMDGRAGSEESYGSQAAWILQQLLDTSEDYFAYYGRDIDALPYDDAWVKKVLALNFVEIDPDDPYTVYINVKNPLPIQFPYLIAGPWAAIISPTSTIKMDYQHAALGTVGTWDGNYSKYFLRVAGRGDTALILPTDGWQVGTGPYVLDSVDPDTYRIVLKANTDYWGGPTDVNHAIGGVPKIATIEYLYQPSLTTRLLDLRAGKATAVAVAALDIYSVADRNKWLNEGNLESLISGVTIHGPFQQFQTIWLNLCTNITNPSGQLKTFQPMADYRIRSAIASSVNMTDVNININNKLGIVAPNVVPPNTVPDGSYNPDIGPSWSFDLANAEEMLVNAWLDPLTSTTDKINYYQNGSRIPNGVIDNSFGESNPQLIEFYYASGATTYERTLATMAENLNRICRRTYDPVTGERSTADNAETLGLSFAVVPVPGGQQYTLASQHRIYAYVGGWVADYNHVLNWLGPAYLSTGTYFSWNYWKIPELDTLYDEAVAADKAGDVEELLRINDEMNTIINEVIPYVWFWYPLNYYVRSSWLQGWYVNPSYGVDVWSSMYYQQP
jgi:ABC-type transport system substrate-binding protein